MGGMTGAPLAVATIGQARWRKKVTVAFDSGEITSDGGVLLLAAAERRLGLADRLDRLITNLSKPRFVVHGIANIRTRGCLPPRRRSYLRAAG